MISVFLALLTCKKAEDNPEKEKAIFLLMMKGLRSKDLNKIICIRYLFIIYNLYLIIMNCIYYNIITYPSFLHR